jgi:hypothetical protein
MLRLAKCVGKISVAHSVLLFYVGAFANGKCFPQRLQVVNVSNNVCKWTTFISTFANGQCFPQRLQMDNVSIKVCNANGRFHQRLQADNVSINFCKRSTFPDC